MKFNDDMNAIIESKNETSPLLAEAIATHRFNADMKPDHLKRLLDVAMFKKFARDEVVFSEGEPANRFYLIDHGQNRAGIQW